MNCGGLVMARYLEPFTLLVAELAYNQHRRPEVGVRFIDRARRVAPSRADEQRGGRPCSIGLPERRRCSCRWPTRSEIGGKVAGRT